MAISESTRASTQRERLPSERASFVHDTAGSILTVRIRGEIDHHTAVSIRQGIDRLLYENRPRKLVLDLSAVGFMDSSGLGLIMGRLSLVREMGGELVIRDPGRETRSILRLAGMEKLVRMEFTAPPEETSQPPTQERRRPSAAGRKSADRMPADRMSADRMSGDKSRPSPPKRPRRRTDERPNPTGKEKQT